MRLPLIRIFIALSLGTAAAWNAAAQEIVLKLHHFLPPTSNGHTRFIQPWTEKVTKESGGRIKFQIYPAMQLGGSLQQLYDQVKDGIVDIGWTLPGATAGRFPRMEVFELPFMMTSAEATSRAAWEYAVRHAPDEFGDVKLLAAFVHSPGYFFLNKRPIKTAADLRGLKLRAPTRQTTKLLAALGATPVGMPVTQVPEALSKSVIDGTIMPYEIVPTLKVHELTKYVTETDARFTALYTAGFVFVMNVKKYKSLPAELRHIIDVNSGRELSAWIATQVWGEPDKEAKEIVKRRGNAINVIDQAQLGEWKKLTDSLDEAWVAEIKGRGYEGENLLKAARGLIEQYSRP